MIKNKKNVTFNGDRLLVSGDKNALEMNAWNGCTVKPQSFTGHRTVPLGVVKVAGVMPPVSHRSERYTQRSVLLFLAGPSSHIPAVT